MFGSQSHTTHPFNLLHLAISLIPLTHLTVCIWQSISYHSHIKTFTGVWQSIQGSKVLFPEHLHLSEIQRGIKSSRYQQGNFLASRENYLEANVAVDGMDKMVRGVGESTWIDW